MYVRSSSVALIVQSRSSSRCVQLCSRMPRLRSLCTLAGIAFLTHRRSADAPAQTWHLVFATIGTRILKRSTRLLDGLANVQMSWDRYFRSIVPIGALFSAVGRSFTLSKLTRQSLVFNNLAYLTLSVSFIQVRQRCFGMPADLADAEGSAPLALSTASDALAFTSVAVLGMSVAFGLESPNQRTLIIVVAICAGVALASFGEVQFALSGFICQAIGIMFEAARLVRSARTSRIRR